MKDSPFAQNEQYALIKDRFDTFYGAILVTNINKVCFCQAPLVKVDYMTGEWPCRSCCDTQTVSGEYFFVCVECYHLLDDGAEAKEDEDPSEEKTFLLRKTAVILNVIS